MREIELLKQWRCPNGHLLGVVERVRVTGSNGGGYHISRLLLFRHAIDLSQDGKLDEVDVIGALEGTMLHIRCDVIGCGETRVWHIGEDALERLRESILGNIDQGRSKHE
jgi:hypothetical protein